MVGAALAGGAAQNKTLPIVAGVLIAGALVGTYFLVARPILKKVGVIEDKKYKKLLSKLEGSNHFNPKFYQAGSISITHTRAKELADQLDDSISGAGTNDEKLFGALAVGRNAHDMSLISNYYQIRHNKSLIADIISDLGEDDLERVVTTLNL